MWFPLFLLSPTIYESELIFFLYWSFDYNIKMKKRVVKENYDQMTNTNRVKKIIFFTLFV